MTLPSCTKGPVWESEEGRTLSGFRLGLSGLSHSAQPQSTQCPYWFPPSPGLSCGKRPRRSARRPAPESDRVNLLSARYCGGG